jgi:HSP20 family protein
MMMLWRPFDLPRFDLTRFERHFANADGSSESLFRPAVDVVENEDHFLLSADLPGVKQQDIDVRVEDGYLTLKGKREQLKTDEQNGYSERRFGSFERRFRLGDAIDAEGIEARYDAGVLTLTLPKRAERKPRQIAIKN